MVFRTHPLRKMSFVGLAVFGLSACEMGSLNNFDLDFRQNNFNTSSAVKEVLKNRPKPDANGVINYPNYQVVVAKRGETVGSIATRLGQNPQALAKYNGIALDEKLRDGAIVALPSKVTMSDVVDTVGQTKTTQNTVDVTTLAQNAIDNAPATPAAPAPTTPKPAQSETKVEPIRHRVTRGETAFTIARLYDVSVRSVAEWNSLDANFTIREGQVLLIPLAAGAKPPAPKSEQSVSQPGAGSITPVPPSAKTPLPSVEKPQTVAATPKAEPKPVATPKGGRLAYPVKGKIIREYAKGKTDGIDISAPSGTSVVAAEAGTVAAITADANQVPIIVIKHADNLLTVYANVADISVKKGDSVSRGKVIGKVPTGNPSYVHFEVRKGLESVDPMTYLGK